MADDTQGDQAETQQASISNTLFPPPPAYFRAFTTENINRYSQLGGPSGTSKNRAHASGHEDPDDKAVLNDEETAELEKLKGLLEPPRADWVKEEGQWKVFGEVHSLHASIPTLSEIGLPPWVDPNESPQTSLPPLLHSFLHTLLLLLDALTNTALTPIELYERGIHHVGDPYIQHLSNLAATMMVSANQLRGVQAEATLVMLMEKQVETRRAQTEALKRSIAESIQKLQTASKDLEGSGQVLQVLPLNVDKLNNESAS